jgi:hypothetical protein
MAGAGHEIVTVRAQRRVLSAACPARGGPPPAEDEQMAQQTEFQKLVGLIRTRDELAGLRHVPLDGLRDAVNHMVGAHVPPGDSEGVAYDLRRALEAWLPNAAVPREPLRPSHAVPAAVPRVGFVAAACERPSVVSDTEDMTLHRPRAAWRWPLLLFWAAFLAGVALALDAADWSPPAVLSALGAVLSDFVGRAVAGDAVSLGAALSGAGLLGIALVNLWVLIRPSPPIDA